MDYTHDKEWRSGVIGVEQTPLPPSRLGTRTQEVLQCWGVKFTIYAEVTQFKANTVIGFTALDSVFPLWGQRMVKPDTTAVRFTHTITVRLHGVYGWLRPLILWQCNRQLQQDLRTLKNRLEQHEQLTAYPLITGLPGN